MPKCTKQQRLNKFIETLTDKGLAPQDIVKHADAFRSILEHDAVMLSKPIRRIEFKKTDTIDTVLKENGACKKTLDAFYEHLQSEDSKVEHTIQDREVATESLRILKTTSEEAKLEIAFNLFKKYPNLNDEEIVTALRIDTNGLGGLSVADSQAFRNGTYKMVPKKNRPEAIMNFLESDKIAKMIRKGGAEKVILTIMNQNKALAKAMVAQVGYLDDGINPLSGAIFNAVSDYQSKQADKYVLNGGFTANEGQKKAIDAIEEFMDSDQQIFMLEGRPGVGKTASLSAALKASGFTDADMAQGKVLIGAPTHKALAVLTGVLPEGNEDKLATVASMTGFVPGKGFQDIKPQMLARLSQAEVIVVDESSMINSETFDQFLMVIGDTKVIFMGDSFQLPPIEGRGTPSEDVQKTGVSRAFTAANTTVELTEVMRQSGDSPIPAITEHFRTSGPQLATVKLDTSTAVEGQLEFVQDGSVAVDQFTKDYQDDPRGTRWVMGNNQVNRNGVAKTQEIRKAIYGEKANNTINVGEQLYLSGSEDLKNEPEYSFSTTTGLKNGTEYTVVEVIGDNNNPSVSTVSLKKWDYNIKRYTYTLIEYATVEVMAENHLTGEIEKLHVPTAASKALAWGNDNSAAMKDITAQVDYGYTMTSDKSQGSTYTNVYVDVGNIDSMNVPNKKGLEHTPVNNKKVKSLYVATSRPREKLVMVNTPPSMLKGGKVEPMPEKIGESEIHPNSDNEVLKLIHYTTPVEFSLGKQDFTSIQDAVVNGNFSPTEHSLNSAIYKAFAADDFKIYKALSESDIKLDDLSIKNDFSGDRSYTDSIKFVMEKIDSLRAKEEAIEKEKETVKEEEVVEEVEEEVVKPKKESKDEKLAKLKTELHETGWFYKDSIEGIGTQDAGTLLRAVKAMNAGNKLTKAQSRVYDLHSSNTLFSDGKMDKSKFLSEEIFDDNVDGFVDHVTDIVRSESNHDTEVSSFYDEMLANMGQFLKENNKDHNLTLQEYSTNDNTHGQIQLGEHASTISIATNNKGEDFMSSKASVLLHEMLHLIGSKTIKDNARLKKKIKHLQNQMREHLEKNGIAAEELYLSNLTEAEKTPEVIQKAREKFNYIFGKNADPEEFLADVVSNPTLIKIVQSTDVNMDKDATKDTVLSKLIRKLLDIVNSVLRSNRFTRGLTHEKLSKDELGSIMQMIYEKNSDNIFQQVLGQVESLVSTLPFGKDITSLSKKAFSKALLALVTVKGYKVSQATINAVKKLAASFVELMPDIKNKIADNKAFQKTIEFLSELGTVKKLLNSELIKSVYYQYFVSESDSNFSAFHRLLRKTEQIDATIGAIEQAVESQFADNDQAFTFKHMIMGTEFYRYVEPSKDDNHLDRGELEARLEGLKPYSWDAKIFEELDKIVDYSHKGDFTGAKHINLKSALKESNVSGYNSSQNRAVAHEYMAISALLKYSDSQIDTLNTLLKEEGIRGIAVQYAKTMEEQVDWLNSRTEQTEGSHDNVPFGWNAHMSNANKAIHYLSASEARFRIGVKEVVGYPSIEADGEVLRAYAVPNYSVSTRPGVITGTSLEIDGYKISNIVKRNKDISREKIQKEITDKYPSWDDEKVRRKTNEVFNAKQLKAIKSIADSMDAAVPLRNAFGYITDYIIPTSSKTKRDTLQAVDSDIHDVSMAFARLNMKINDDKKLYGFTKSEDSDEYTGIVDELFDMDKKMKEDGYKGRTFRLSDVASTEELERISGITGGHADLGDLLVPEEFRLPLFGSTTMSAANIGWVKKVPYLSDGLSIAEEIAKTLSQRMKASIAMLNPAVVLGNIASNFTVASQHGVSPDIYLGKFISYMRDLEDFNSLLLGLEQAKIRSFGGNDVGEHSIDAITKQIENHRFNDLYKAGHISASAEDVDSRSSIMYERMLGNQFQTKQEIATEARQLAIMDKKSGDFDNESEESLINKHTKRLSSGLNKIPTPEIMKNFFNEAYMTAGSHSEQAAAQFLLYTDIVAKQLILDHGNLSGTTNKKISLLSDMFINYGTPLSAMEDYAERVGQTWFLKYLFRSLKGVYAGAKASPVGALALIGLEQGFDVDITDPSDSNMKNGTLEALANRFKGDEVDQTAFDYLTPRLFEAFSEVNSNPLIKPIQQ